MRDFDGGGAVEKEIMEIIEKKLSEITPYENNPRKNDDAVEYVANSIREFGWKVPIVIDKDGVIIIANMADVYLFSKLKEKSGGRLLWLRNNVSTILCNCLENFGFIWLAFVGIYDTETILTIAISTSVIEAIVALCDTPFLYLAGRIKRNAD